MTTLNTSFCENMCYAVLKVKKIKELCNHNSWKEGKKRGGGRGAETEVRLKLQCPRSTASVTVLAYDTGRVFLGPGVDVTPAKLCVFLWKGGILGGGFPPV